MKRRGRKRVRMRMKIRSKRGGKMRKMQMRQRSCGHIKLTGCHCHLWHKRALCRHAAPPQEATNT